MIPVRAGRQLIEQVVRFVGWNQKKVLSYEGMVLWMAGPKVSPIMFRVLKRGGDVQGEE